MELISFVQVWDPRSGQSPGRRILRWLTARESLESMGGCGQAGTIILQEGFKHLQNSSSIPSSNLLFALNHSSDIKRQFREVLASERKGKHLVKKFFRVPRYSKEWISRERSLFLV